MDSITTVAQKRAAYEEIFSWTQYLQVHGLGDITLADLRTAEKALAQTRVHTPGEDELRSREDPLWLAFVAGANAALPVPITDERTLADWTELKEDYRRYRRRLEE